MKPLIQSEAAECGLACLAMVAGHYGLHMDLPQMRRRFPLSLKGLRLNQLIEHAQQLGLNARALRLEMQDLGQLKLPCILHWDLNHFVVLARVGRKKAVLLDPASGRREMDLQEVSRHFTGVALELAPAPQFRPQRAAPAVSLRQLTGPVRGLWGALAQVLLLSAALQVFVVLAPVICWRCWGWASGWRCWCSWALAFCGVDGGSPFIQPGAAMGGAGVRPFAAAADGVF